MSIFKTMFSKLRARYLKKQAHFSFSFITDPWYILEHAIASFSPRNVLDGEKSGSLTYFPWFYRMSSKAKRKANFLVKIISVYSYLTVLCTIYSIFRNSLLTFSFFEFSFSTCRIFLNNMSFRETSERNQFLKIVGGENETKNNTVKLFKTFLSLNPLWQLSFTSSRPSSIFHLEKSVSASPADDGYFVG